jgi:heptaprenyl diphosphate synthase
VLRLRERAARLALPEDIALCELLDSDLGDDARLAEALAALRAHPALEQARRDTVRYAKEARAALAPLRECEAKLALLELCDAVVHRAG